MSEESKQKTSLWEKTVKLLPKKDNSKSERSRSSVSKKSMPSKVTPPESPAEAMAEDQSQTKNTLQLETALALKKSAQKFKKNVEAGKIATTPLTKKNKNKTGKEKHDAIDTEEETGHVWDEHLSQMEISKKRHSVLHREIAVTTGSRNVKVLAPMPEYYSVSVRKIKQNIGKICSYPVMKPASPDALVEKLLCYGPRLNSEGRIIRHSILGEASDFLREATKRKQFKDIIGSQVKVFGKRKDVMPACKPSTRCPENREDLALQSWNREMNERKLEMKRLAGLIGCPERQLLMSKTDDFVSQTKGRQLMTAALDYNQEKHPDVCFWKLQPAVGSKQIQTTLTRQEKGGIPTPEMSGDAASIKAQKGSLREPFESSWFSSDYLRDRDQQMGGVIKIYNQMLFDDLEVCGQSIAKPHQSDDSRSAADNAGLCSPGGDADSHTCMDDLVKEAYTKRENCLTGPCLKIEDTILSWVEGRYQGDRVVKATYILIEGLAGDMCHNYIYLQNCGTTSIRYHWSKCIEVKPIPVPRPRRPAAFYLNDEDGVILPGDTGKIEVKFRSHVPGCFSESWLLGTVPLLAAGGQIKFILKGWARVKKDYSEECHMIQETLEKREAATLCSYLTNEIIEKIILRAYLESISLRDDPDSPTEDLLFVQENNGLFFHAHVVKRLKTLYNSLTIELTGSPTSVNDAILSITRLNKLIHSLPDASICDNDDDEDGDNDDDECSSRKEMLLWKLYCDINILSFTPFTPCVSPSHLRYIICYGLLNDGVREVMDLAEFLANHLDIVLKQPTEAELEAAKPKEKGRGKGHINSGKPKKKKDEEPKDLETKGAVTAGPKPQAFSPVYQYRVKNVGDNSVLNQYDEKMYLMMYSMLDGVVNKMMDLFDTL